MPPSVDQMKQEPNLWCVSLNKKIISSKKRSILEGSPGADERIVAYKKR